MYIVTRFMGFLMFAVFAFFWLHCIMWFYREYKDRQAKNSKPHVRLDALPIEKGKYFQRFAWPWRVAHLFFALSVMTLILTGMAALYSQTSWAAALMALVGGPHNAGIIHRIAATTMLSIFGLHLCYVVYFLITNRKTFNWFGPASLLPRLQDAFDVIGMFKWGFGLGPRPAFDRWTYWEKFDYWAVFWGMAIIGSSGTMLVYPDLTAAIMPGWVFNVGTFIHGEEALLAAVFLFTVHFFNNHLRPEKMPPPDVVMFTGAVNLDEFKHEHWTEYQRLVDSGELAKHLVDVPSKPMTVASRLLGLVLLCFGFILLILVLIGFFGHHAG
jgi:cytochrome b subunit of formate dehydrogenase